MASQGPNAPSTGSATGGGTVWTNPGNITAQDGVEATAALVASGTSQELQATGFGFSIPAAAKILGIQVDWKVARAGGTGTVANNDVTLLKAGVATGNNLGDVGGGAGWTSTLTFHTYGSSTQLWGATWLPSDINASNFGVQFSAIETGGVNSVTAGVDFVQITVTYSLPGGFLMFFDGV